MARSKSCARQSLRALLWLQLVLGAAVLGYGVYLLVSCWFLIAGTGTVFEYAYKEPLFGVLPADSFLYAPASGVLFLGALLGAGKTWFTATRLANAENERDGYGQ